ncbi:hypothetical protein NQ317_004965 [Molorchus minor]|uniref:Uncharacterized protein n=1 Tax=Molorchus minor TaxID=1323400 RepID=A0ABQ9K3G2_9CUCU|nr:hypothetical protein NQ317_004965 [Molorchus minor]
MCISITKRASKVRFAPFYSVNSVMLSTRFLKRIVPKSSHIQRIGRRHKTWYPDAEWFAQFEGPVMYPDELTSRFKRQSYNAKKPPER